jgi:ABC-type dipeptide/oligopeptide/nickel transport system permease component
MKHALGALTLWVVSVTIIGAIQFLPGEIAPQTLGKSATPETVAAFRRSLIPISTDQNPWAQSRNPMDMMCQG